MDRHLPKYPIFIPSKGRAAACLTGQFLVRDGVPFSLVVEAQEFDAYAAAFGTERLVVLPFRDQGLPAARNWIKTHSTAAGHARHWQLDDNISRIRRWCPGNKRIPVRAGVALRVTEDFVDRYENVAIAGLNYNMFGYPTGTKGKPPFHLNVHVYSCFLVNNAIPHLWRGDFNEDVDMSLQVLADGWCTVLVNAFLAEKRRTMQMAGGNTAKYFKQDGRLRVTRELIRRWPYVVSLGRRFQRPHHVVKDQWARFDTPLKLKPGAAIPQGVDNYGLTLTRVAPGDKA